MKQPPRKRAKKPAPASKVEPKPDDDGKKLVALLLTQDELRLVLEGLDSYRYWQLSDEDYRHDGFVLEPGSDDPETVEQIEAVDDLEVRLEGVMRAQRERPSSLIDAAQAVLRDGRHWSAVDVVYRAESATDLAEMILSAFGVEEAACPKKCAECREHARSLKP